MLLILFVNYTVACEDSVTALRTVNECEALVKWYQQGKTKVHGENLSHYHIVQHKS